MAWIRRETEKGTVQYICSNCNDYHEFREDFGERTFNENFIFCRRCGVKNGTGTAPTITPPNEWVSVEDEIPSDDDDGLEFFCMTNATGKGGGVLPLEWEVATIRGKTVRRWRWLNRISPWTVTHWMKRPAPLEKENSHE